MNWLPWFLGPPIHLPPIPATAVDGRSPPDELDVALIELTYLFIANEQKCSQCGHLLGRGLRVRHARGAATLRWPVWVDTRCWGQRRHPYLASVTRPSKDLMLGGLHPRFDRPSHGNTKDST